MTVSQIFHLVVGVVLFLFALHRIVVVSVTYLTYVNYSIQNPLMSKHGPLLYMVGWIFWLVVLCGVAYVGYRFAGVG